MPDFLPSNFKDFFNRLAAILLF